MATQSFAATFELSAGALVGTLARIQAAQELLGDLVGADEPLWPLKGATELLVEAAGLAPGDPLLREAAARGREMVADMLEGRYVSLERLRAEAEALRWGIGEP